MTDNEPYLIRKSLVCCGGRTFRCRLNDAQGEDVMLWEKIKMNFKVYFNSSNLFHILIFFTAGVKEVESDDVMCFSACIFWAPKCWIPEFESQPRVRIFSCIRTLSQIKLRKCVS